MIKISKLLLDLALTGGMHDSLFCTTYNSTNCFASLRPIPLNAHSFLIASIFLPRPSASMTSFSNSTLIVSILILSKYHAVIGGLSRLH